MAVSRLQSSQSYSTFWDIWKCGEKDTNNFRPPYMAEAAAASIEKKDPKLGHKKMGSIHLPKLPGVIL